MEGNQEAEHQGSGRRAKEGREETRRIGPTRTLVLHPAKTVTQVELEEAAALQAVAWKAEEAAHRAVRKIGRRVVAGAVVETGRFEYDAASHMVRTRKEMAG